MADKSMMIKDDSDLGLFRLFDDLFPASRTTMLSIPEPPKAWMPRVDVQETEKEYVLTAALPGVRKEDVKVEIKDGMLSVSGERKAEKEEKGKTYLRREMTYGAFHRCLALPDGVHPEDVHASCKEGILTVNVRKPAEAKNRGISVKVD